MRPHPDAPEGLPTPLFLFRTVILLHLCPQKDIGWYYSEGLCRVRVPCASLACWLGCWLETLFLTGRSWFFARQAFHCFLLSEWVMQEREAEAAVSFKNIGSDGATSHWRGWHRGTRKRCWRLLVLLKTSHCMHTCQKSMHSGSGLFLHCLPESRSQILLVF